MTVIRVIPNQLLQGMNECVCREKRLFVPNNLYSKIAVVERHHNTGKVGVGAVMDFNIQNGAIASTVAHDSHNLSVIGDNDAGICCAP